MFIFLWNSWYLELILKRCPRSKNDTSGKHWQLPSLPQPQEQLLQQILLQFLTPVSFWRCLCSYTCEIIHIHLQTIYVLTGQLHLEMRFPSWFHGQVWPTQKSSPQERCTFPERWALGWQSPHLLNFLSQESVLDRMKRNPKSALGTRMNSAETPSHLTIADFLTAFHPSFFESGTEIQTLLARTQCSATEQKGTGTVPPSSLALLPSILTFLSTKTPSEKEIDKCVSSNSWLFSVHWPMSCCSALETCIRNLSPMFSLTLWTLHQGHYLGIFECALHSDIYDVNAHCLIQGGRCFGTLGPAVTERSGSSTKGRTPDIRYFVAKLSIVAIYKLFKMLLPSFEWKSFCFHRGFVLKIRKYALN